MFAAIASLFIRKSQPARVSPVRPASVLARVRGEWVVILARHENGTVDYRFEDDRLNIVHTGYVTA